MEIKSVQPPIFCMHAWHGYETVAGFYYKKILTSLYTLAKTCLQEAYPVVAINLVGISIKIDEREKKRWMKSCLKFVNSLLRVTNR